jgi:hypothetical protein
MQWHRSVMPVLLPPHFASAREDVPDLLDRAVGHRCRSLAGSELEMRHTAGLKAKENAHV